MILTANAWRDGASARRLMEAEFSGALGYIIGLSAEREAETARHQVPQRATGDDDEDR
jgi:hypothetical protein